MGLASISQLDSWAFDRGSGLGSVVLKVYGFRV